MHSTGPGYCPGSPADLDRCGYVSLGKIHNFCLHGSSAQTPFLLALVAGCDIIVTDGGGCDLIVTDGGGDRWWWL